MNSGAARSSATESFGVWFVQNNSIVAIQEFFAQAILIFLDSVLSAEC